MMDLPVRDFFCYLSDQRAAEEDVFNSPPDGVTHYAGILLRLMYLSEFTSVLEILS
jgi:hypothetical protein